MSVIVTVGNKGNLDSLKLCFFFNVNTGNKYVTFLRFSDIVVFVEKFPQWHIRPIQVPY